MLFPSVAVERRDILPFRDWRPSFQRRMRPMSIVEVLEFEQFLFQVGRGPEQHPIQAFSSQGADQPFDKRMRHRNIRHTLNLAHYAGYESANGTMFPVAFKKPIPVAPKERLVTISIDGKTKAYPFPMLRRSKVTTGRIKKRRFVIFFDPSAVTTMGAEQITESKKVGAVGVFSPEGASVIHCCCLALISFQQRHLCPILAMAEVVNAKIGCKCLHDGPLGSSHQH